MTPESYAPPELEFVNHYGPDSPYHCTPRALEFKSVNLWTLEHLAPQPLDPSNLRTFASSNPVLIR